MKTISLRFINLLFFFLLFGFFASGASFFVSSAGGSFHSGAAWNATTCGGAGSLSWPTTSADVVNITCAHTITVSSTPETCGAITINGGTLIINGGDVLNCTSLTMTSGTLTVNGTLNVGLGGTGAFSITGGTFTAAPTATGTVILSSTAQAVTGPSSGTLTFYNLTVANSGAKTLANNSTNYVIYHTLTQTGSATLAVGTNTLSVGTGLNGTGITQSSAFITTTSSTTLSFGGGTYNITLGSSLTNTWPVTLAAFTMTSNLATITLGSSQSLTVTGAFNLSSGGNFVIGPNTLTLNGTVSGSISGEVTGSSTSDLAFGGSSSGSIYFSLSSTGVGGTNTIRNLTNTNTLNPLTMLSNLRIGGTLTQSSSSSKISINGQQITIDGSLSGSGGFQGSTTSSMIINGTGALGANLTFITTLSLSSLQINRSSGSVVLGSNLTMSGGNVTMTQGTLDINNKTLDLGTSSSIASETSTNRIFCSTCTSTTGKITSSSNSLASNTTYTNLRGLGLDIITSTTAPGSTTVNRGFGAQSGAALSNSILRWYDITPSTNSGLNATLNIKYWSATELNSLTEANLLLFNEAVGNGGAWARQGGTVNTTTHAISLTGINSFTEWTAGAPSCSTPLNSNTHGAGSTFAAYTIGGSSPDYATFTAAVAALNNCGISGPVVFNVRTGTYTEQISIPAIGGSSSTNTVTFQAETGVASNVTLQSAAGSSSANDYVVQFNGCSYVNFNHLTVNYSGASTLFARVFWFTTAAGNCTIDNCSITGITGTANTGCELIYCNNSGAANGGNNTISNNALTNGGYGIFYEGVSSSTTEAGLSIFGNTLSNQRASSIYLQNLFQVQVYLNKINNACTTTTFYGIDLESCTGDATHFSNIYNNWITAPNCCINNNGSSFLGVYYNNANTTTGTGTGTNSAAFFSTGGTSGTIKINNNIFVNSSGTSSTGGYAVYISTSSAISSLDYNDYYANGPYIGNWSGTMAKMADWKYKSGFDSHSAGINPLYTSSTNLHVQYTGFAHKGTVISGFTTDISGATRDVSNPDIGAEENGGTTHAALSGSYTIGGSTPDYSTIYNATEELNFFGVSAAVTFNIRSATYTEQIAVGPITGASGTNTVTYQSQSQDSTAATIQYSTLNDNSYEHYTVHLVNTSFITFKWLTISATSATNGHAISLHGNPHDNNILNNIINGISTTSSGTTLATIWQPATDNTSNANTNTISNNNIKNGSYGIFMTGQSSGSLETGIVVQGNLFTDQGGFGVDLVDMDAPQIIANMMTNSRSVTFTGILCNTCQNSVLVKRNEIYSTTANGQGIDMEFCTGTSGTIAEISNNMIVIGSGGSSVQNIGILTNQGKFENIWFNSVRTNSTFNSGQSNAAFKSFNTGNNQVIQNNIFVNKGTGAGANAIVVTASASIQTLDYNDLFTAGSFMGFWVSANSSSNTLSSWQTASGKDAHAVSADPESNYVSSTSNLRLATANSTLNAGTPVTLTTDIDGNTRSSSTPEMGASELSACSVSASINSHINVSCNGGSNGTAVVTASGSAPFTYSWSPGGGTSSTASGLTAQNYTVTVTATGSCTATASVTITQPAALAANAAASAATCNGYSNGSVSASPSGGASGYTYIWSPGGLTTSSITGLSATGITYTVTVTDTHSCTATGTATVTQPTAVTAGTSATGATCYGGSDGTVTSSPGGGSGSGYIYSWTGGSTASTVTGLTAGTYTVTVTDGAGCTGTSTATVTQPSPVPVPFVYSVNNCDGSSTLTTTASGTLSWSTGEITSAITVTTAGTYSVTQTDGTGCVSVAGTGNSLIGVCYSLKLFLQGYYIETNTMSPLLKLLDASPFPTDVDTVTVELRTAADPGTVAFSSSGILQSDGSLHLTFDFAAQNNDYYIVVKHRNSLTTWSAATVNLTASGIYDFTTGANQAFGSGNTMADMGGGVYAIYGGDINGDGSINISDKTSLQSVLSTFTIGVYNVNDITGDGFVDEDDLRIIQNNAPLSLSVQHP